MIKGKCLFQLLLKVKRDKHGIFQLKNSADLFCYGLELFASFCLSVAGSDLGLQLFVRIWQHLAVLRGEVQSWGCQVHREENYFAVSRSDRVS